MLSITDVFKDKTSFKNKQGAFIPYFIVGYPDLKTSLKLIKEASYYSDIIELGIPFSDPIADGKTIQYGVQRALEANLSLDTILEHTSNLSMQIQTPLVYMIYFNQIFTYGMERFIKRAKKAGVAGLVIPDLLPYSEPSFNKMAKTHNIDLIFFVSPTTKDNKLNSCISESSGFIYLIANLGVTGIRNNIRYDIKKIAQNLRLKTDIPICVGFGISKKEHVTEVYKFSDGAIVGSAIIKVITDNLDNEDDCISKTIEKVKSLALL